MPEANRSGFAHQSGRAKTGEVVRIQTAARVSSRVRCPAAKASWDGVAKTTSPLQARPWGRPPGCEEESVHRRYSAVWTFEAFSLARRFGLHVSRPKLHSGKGAAFEPSLVLMTNNQLKQLLPKPSPFLPAGDSLRNSGCHLAGGRVLSLRISPIGGRKRAHLDLSSG